MLGIQTQTLMAKRLLLCHCIYPYLRAIPICKGIVQQIFGLYMFAIIGQLQLLFQTNSKAKI